jgi:hypothetical protein
MTDPEFVIAVGDLHGNSLWTFSQLPQIRRLVPDEDPLIVLSLGDFGFWPGASFASDVSAIARELGIRVLVTPGNHEDYGTMLPAWEDSFSSDHSLVALPRGTRWTWHGRTWLSVGGATSPDRESRTEGVSWWPEEELTDEEVTAIVAGGPADVLLTHDVGTAVDLHLPPWPRMWPESERVRAEAHRDRVQRLTDGISPQWQVHGHYHQFHRSYVPATNTHVTGLNMDGKAGNWGVLNVRDMEWEEFNE